MFEKALFNLSALAKRLIAEKRLLKVAYSIKNAVDAQSIAVDLRLALEACDALIYSLDNPMNQPPEHRTASEAALLNYIMLLYARATKTSSDERNQYDPRPKFTSDQLEVHRELCQLRDKAVAHFGSRGSYVGNWSVELAVMDVAQDVARPAVFTRRQIVDRPLLARARAQIECAYKIVSAVAGKRIDDFTEALNEAVKGDPGFYREICQHPLNRTIFLSSDDQVEEMRAGRKLDGHASGVFRHK